MYLISTNNGLYKAKMRRDLNKWLVARNLPKVGERGALKLPDLLQGRIIEIDGRAVRYVRPIKVVEVESGLFAPIDALTPLINAYNLPDLIQSVSPPKAEQSAKIGKRAPNLISKNNSGRFSF